MPTRRAVGAVVLGGGIPREHPFGLWGSAPARKHVNVNTFVDGSSLAVPLSGTLNWLCVVLVDVEMVGLDVRSDGDEKDV